MCVDLPFLVVVCVFLLVGWGSFCLDILEYLGVIIRKCQSSVYSPYTITNLEKSKLARIHPVVYLSSAFYTQSKPTPAFSVKATYTPLSCLPQTQEVAVSSQLHWLLVCFGQLYIRFITQVLPGYSSFSVELTVDTKVVERSTCV